MVVKFLLHVAWLAAIDNWKWQMLMFCSLIVKQRCDSRTASVPHTLTYKVLQKHWCFTAGLCYIATSYQLIRLLISLSILNKTSLPCPLAVAKLSWDRHQISNRQRSLLPSPTARRFDGGGAELPTGSQTSPKKLLMLRCSEVVNTHVLVISVAALEASVTLPSQA